MLRKAIEFEFADPENHSYLLVVYMMRRRSKEQVKVREGRGGVVVVWFDMLGVLVWCAVESRVGSYVMNGLWVYCVGVNRASAVR